MSRIFKKIIIAITAGVFLFSGFMVFVHYSELKTGEKLSEEISEMAVTERFDEEPAKTEEPVFEEEKETVIVPIEVDFELLFGQNEDVIGWIYCPGTPINYPIVQAADNEFYLRRLLDGSYNMAGTLFLDYRNSVDFTDWNSIVYGHNLRNDLMFGTLPNYAEQEYFDEHPVIFLLTPEKNYRISILFGFTASAGSGFYNELHPTEEEKAELIKNWRNVSDFVSKTELPSEYRLITLSTCSYDYSDARYVIIGLLEEI